MAFEENAPYTMLWVEFTMWSENNICIFTNITNSS